jgi:hypothetical protein
MILCFSSNKRSGSYDNLYRITVVMLMLQRAAGNLYDMCTMHTQVQIKHA